MDRQELIDKVFDLVKALSVPTIDDNYRQLFFDRFKMAYKSGVTITGDNLLDEIQYKKMPDEVKDLIQELALMWDQWQYAFEHYE